MTTAPVPAPADPTATHSAPAPSPIRYAAGASGAGRVAAGTLLVGGVVSCCALVAGAIVGEDRFDTLRVVVSTVEAVGGLLVLLGMPVLLRGVGRRGRALMLGGYVPIFAVTALIQVFLGLTFALVVPWVISRGVDVTAPPPALGAVLFASGPLATLGIALLAAGVLRAGAHPRWAGWALAGSAVMSVGSLVGLPEVVDMLSVVVLFGTFAALGGRCLAASSRDV